MRISVSLSLALGLALFGAAIASAKDYWDASVITDNTAIDTFNEMYHGESQQHDLEANPGPVADEDWSFVMAAPYSSYEAIIDSGSADVYDQALDRFDADGTTLLQVAEAGNAGAPVSTIRAVRWYNVNGAYALNFLRTRSGGCTTTCGPAAQYHIRFYETTMAVPRFNNASSQVTVLLIQNTRVWNRPVAGFVYYWSGSGTLLGTSVFVLDSAQSSVINTAAVPGLAGQAGTITIAHDGGYGGLAVKSVALEPATGFSFDSPGVYKPK